MHCLARYLTRAFRTLRIPVLPICAVLAAALCCAGAFAQSGAGSIQGTVTDPTGAVIPNATIHVANQATGEAIDTKSNSVGFYQAPGLFTGTYVVTVTAPGMETYNRTLELLVSQTFVADVAMSTGTVNQQVTVNADSVQLVTSDNGSITSTLENARINELPMNGRNIITLVNETTPGLENCPESSSCGNGQEGPATEYEVDGATITNREFGGVHQGQQQMVDPDTIQEVRVEDEAGGAQYAAPTTAILSTKSGTNSLHGSAFWTARNNAFGVARTRNNPTNYAAPEYIRNEAGASVGGPIVIPHLYHGKNKSFFFFAYERYSLAQSPFQSQSTPTQAMRSGDFSGLTSSSNVLQELYDPATTRMANTAACPEPTAAGSAAPANAYCRTPFPGNPATGSSYNFINPSREAPLAATFMQMTPLPTPSLAGVNPLVGTNLDTNYFELDVQPQITFRVDQDFNENNRAYVRFTHNPDSNLVARNDPAQAYTLPATAPSPSGAAIPKWVSGTEFEPAHVDAAAIGYTHIFSPSFVSETVLSQTWYGEITWSGPIQNTDFESELGLPNNFGESGFPIVEGSSTTHGNVAALFQPFDGTMFSYSVTTTTYNVDENLTKTLGKHQLMFGGRYRFEHMGSLPDRSKDSLEFDGLGTGLLNPSTYSASAASAYSNSGNANADEFLGSAYTYGVNLQAPYQHLHDMEFDAYIQDNYRVRNNLTLNLGLRYEAHPAAWEGLGQMMGFDIKNDAIVTSGTLAQLESEGLTTAAIIANDENLSGTGQGAKFETPSQAGLPSMLVYNYNLNFAPRVGAAWQPFGKWGTVLRGAVGRYIYPVPVREGYREEDTNNPLNVGYSENYTSSQYTPHSNYMLLAAPNSASSFNFNTTNPTTAGGTPIMGANSASVVNSNNTTAIPPGLGITNIDPVYPPTYVDEANFTIEQPIKRGSVLRVSYLYTHGTNLNNYFYYNNHPSTYSWEIQQGAETPSSSAFGPYNSNTGEGPYDNLTYGDGSKQIQKTGWSNYHALQANYQKLFHNGSAWQVMYVWEKNLRTGGDYGGEGGDYVDPYINYVNSYIGNYVGAGANTVTVGPADANSAMPGPPNLPPPPPAGVQPWQYYKALNRWENYMVDTNTPPQHLQFNGLLDLPFGRGKRWLSGVNKPLNEAVGGWQISGAGGVEITNFAITSTNWGPANPLKIYKKSAPITDCRSGTCLKAYEWFNGYIAPTAVSSNACSAGLTTVVNNLPSGWASYQAPLDTSCSAPANGKTVVDKYYGDNDVAMSGVTGVGSSGGSQQANGTVIGYGVVPANNDNGASESAIDVTNPFGHTILNGPWNWNADASLFKLFPITERVNLRLNVDAFNVFNHQNLPNPSGSDGTVCYSAGGVGCSSSTFNVPRQIQFSLRLNY